VVYLIAPALLFAALADPDPYATRTLTLSVAAGPDTPAGDWSVGLGAELGRRLAVAVSVGEDLSGHHLRFSLAPRFRWLVAGRFALDGALVLSQGDGDERGGTAAGADGRGWNLERRWDDFWRLQPELGLEVRLTPRLALRAFGGVGVPFTGSTCRAHVTGGGYGDSCDAPDLPPDLAGDRDRRLFPYGGLSVTLGLKSFGTRETEGAAPRRVPGWYGWQTLTVDAASVATGLLLPRDGGLYGGVVDLTGVVVVHGLHDRFGRGLASAAMRVALGFAGAAIGLAATTHEGDDDQLEGAGPGALAGAATAALIDAVFLARGE
jgi:hypothetical protein